MPYTITEVDEIRLKVADSANCYLAWTLKWIVWDEREQLADRDKLTTVSSVDIYINIPLSDTLVGYET